MTDEKTRQSKQHFEIHVIRKFFEAKEPAQGHFFEKIRKPRLYFTFFKCRVYVPNFLSLSFFIWPGGLAQINKSTLGYSDIETYK